MSFPNSGGSSNKVRVTRLLGGSAPLGHMDPKVGMPVYVSSVVSIGNIASLDSGNYTVVVGLGTGNHMSRFYPWDLFTTETWATGVGNSAWPTGDGSILAGHHGVFPNGVPIASGNNMDYLNGNGIPTTFFR